MHVPKRTWGSRRAMALAIAVSWFASPVWAQQAAPAAPATLAGALASDVGTLSDKFVGLAKAMAAKYDWRPSQGVRSAGEVFNLIVMENRMLAGVLNGAPAAGGRPAPITDPTELQDALKSSYAALQQAIGGLSEADLKAAVQMFRRDTTKQGAVLMLLFDQHEHLGQSIAYARSNNIVPPWSQPRQ